MRTMIRKRLRHGLIGIAATPLLLGACASQAIAAGPAWDIVSAANTSAPAGGQIQYLISARNVGDADTDGSQVDLSVTLPDGLTANSAAFVFGLASFDCSGLTVGDTTFVCTSTDVIEPDSELGFSVIADVAAGATGATPTAAFSISGGGAATASIADATMISDTPPGFGIDSFDGQVTSGPSGAALTQAGGRPFGVSTQILFNTVTDPEEGDVWPVEPLKNVVVDVPPGLIGNPTAVGQCTMETIAVPPLGACPPKSQVGVVRVRFNLFSGVGMAPVYSLVPPPDVPARFGFVVAGTLITLDATLRSGSDYGLQVSASNSPETFGVAGTELTLWGYPADPIHDPQRFCPDTLGFGCPTEAEVRPFLRTPTACTEAGVGLETKLRADSWYHPGDFAQASFVSHLPPGFPSAPDLWGAPQGPTDCDAVPFDPEIVVEPSVKAADSPTGLSVDLTLPQPETSIATSDLKKAVVALPEGMSVNPASAAGLGSCSQAQIGLDNDEDPGCLGDSKIGSLAIDTPLLEEQLEGSVYLASQGQNKFGSLIAVYFVAKGPGVIVKLAGKVEPTGSGQLITTFDDQPQLPFERLHVEFFDGPRASLRTPSTCGTHTATADLSPWARPDEPVHLESSFQITSGPNGTPCPPDPARFDPKLSGGSVNPIAGAHSPFVLRLRRDDATQEFASLDVRTPRGFSAKLAGVGSCPDSTLAAISSALGTGAAENALPSCPASSRLGNVAVGAGAGSSPFYVDTGRAYLAGPYKGAPLSLAIVTPALAGPFDLGNVVVRSAIELDPRTAEITVKSDPIPSVLAGIPLDVRDIRVNIDRPDFTLNPTSCDPMSIDARVTSTKGAVANPSQRFQVAGCGDLGFKPKLGISLSGGTKRGKHPALRAVLQARSGDANIGRVQVALPRTAFLDQANIRTVCTRVQFAAEACPPGSIYGRAVAHTPLLDQPIEGPVYLRSSNNTLPDLVMALRGPDHQPIEIELAGRIDTLRGGIRTTFEAVPDAPVSKFVLTMQGGKRKGLIVNSRDICAARSRATVKMDGQNGRIRDFRPLVRNSNCAKQRRAKRR